jgi:hypothetical protein
LTLISTDKDSNYFSEKMQTWCRERVQQCSLLTLA